jgi:hypothetical protein
MNKKEFRTMSLYQLHRLCQTGEENALSEWKRRWESDYPKIAEADYPLHRQIKKLPGASTPGKK